MASQEKEEKSQDADAQGIIKFHIKHRSGGKFWHIHGGHDHPGDTTSIRLWEGTRASTVWYMVPILGHWGYITHNTSGKRIHPKGGSLNPGNETKIVIHGDRHHGALFAIDEVNNCVIHRGGRYVHPKGGHANPGQNTELRLHSDKHDSMRFLFVDENDTNKEVLVYGKPTVIGKWRIINSILNPEAEHTASMEVKVGKSQTESTTSTFEYKWELTASGGLGIITGSASQSVRYMIEKSSSTTWSKEVTVKRQIKVYPGKSVVTWQYYVDVTQHENRGFFQCNLLADTNSIDDVPEEPTHHLP